MTRLRKYLGLAPGDRRLLNRAFLALVVASVSLKVMPLRRLARRLPSGAAPSRGRSDGEESRRINRISWAVRLAARQVPWNATCLTQAIAAKQLLRRHGIASTLYFGVDRGPENRLEAHTWVVAGDADVVGGKTRERYKVVASFS